MILWFDNYPDAYWDGPYHSSEKIMKNYSWDEEGIYDIKVKSKDIYGYETATVHLIKRAFDRK